MQAFARLVRGDTNCRRLRIVQVVSEAGRRRRLAGIEVTGRPTNYPSSEAAAICAMSSSVGGAGDAAASPSRSGRAS